MGHGQEHKNPKLLNEISWGDEPQAEEEGSGDNPEQTANSAFDNINFLNKLDKQFDKVYSDVTRDNAEDLQLFSSKMQKMELSNFAKSITKKLSPERDETQQKINELMNSGQDDILKIFDDSSVHANRKKLYDMYQEISNINNIAYRMLQVYINNILVKNSQSKQFLNVIENPYNARVGALEEELRDNIKKFIKTLLLYFDIQQKFKNKIIPETLKLGDFYIEVVDLSPVDDILDNKISILQESVSFIDVDKRTGKESKITRIANLAYFEDCTLLSTEQDISESGEIEATPVDFGAKMAKILNKKTTGAFSLEESDVNFWSDVMDSNDYNKDFDLADFQDLDFDLVEDLYLRLLSPSNILKIEKEGNQYGYLIVENIDAAIDPNNEIDMYQRFLRDDNDGGKSGQKYNSAQEEHLADKLVDSITTKLGEIIGRDSGYLSEMPDELKSSLRVIAYEKIRSKQKLKFRFLQSDKLINFHTSIDKYRPYGTSIYDPIILPVKLYTIAMMSSVISRLSRAAVVRKWNIEVGTKRNYPEIIDKVKKDLRSKSISYDNLSSIRNISQVLTDFRDIAVVSQNGQKFIDWEIVPMQDRALPLNDMQDLRNELVAATGVPSVYLNIGDAIELRETLVNINIGFSHTISNLQGYFEDGMNDLLNTIFETILRKNGFTTNFKLTQFFKITLNHPLVLQLQSNESVISTVGNIIGILTQAGVTFDPIELFKKYAPDFDWNELETTGEEALKKKQKDKIIGGDGQGGY